MKYKIPGKTVFDRSPDILAAYVWTTDTNSDGEDFKSKYLKSCFEILFWFVILISNPMYSAGFDFDCKSHFAGFCGLSAVLKSKPFDGGKIANAVVVCPSVCVCVCLSHSGIVSKRLNIRSCK